MSEPTINKPTINLCLLDDFHLTVEVRPRKLGPVLERLLALLAVHNWSSRYVIARMLWQDHSDDAALAALRTAVWRLQQQAPGAVKAGVRTLALTSRVHVDLHEFITWAQRVLRDPGSLTEDELEPPTAGAELLPGWYDEWLEPERQRLHQLRVHALETLAGEYLERGRPSHALVAAFTVLNMDLLRESAHRLVVRIHLAEGNVGAALRQYAACAEVLQTEVGVSPSTQMAELIAPYLRGRAGARAGARTRSL
jgi:DNA-binding SARP family transcriptional activator